MDIVIKKNKYFALKHIIFKAEPWCKINNGHLPWRFLFLKSGILEKHITARANLKYIYLGITVDHETYSTMLRAELHKA